MSTLLVFFGLIAVLFFIAYFYNLLRFFFSLLGYKSQNDSSFIDLLMLLVESKNEKNFKVIGYRNKAILFFFLSFLAIIVGVISSYW